jgi:hypothetical protein
MMKRFYDNTVVLLLLFDDDRHTAKEGLVKIQYEWLVPFMYSQKWNCYFQNIIVMFCLPVPTIIYLWENYIFPGSVCLFWCKKICGPILGI